jgi:hypothetical protein
MQWVDFSARFSNSGSYLSASPHARRFNFSVYIQVQLARSSEGLHDGDIFYLSTSSNRSHVIFRARC